MEIKKWLAETPVGDVMMREVVTVNAGDPLAQAAEVLLREQIGGAPVVDGGECVGVLSASDVIGAEGKAEEEREKIAQSSFWSANLLLPASVYAEKLAAVRDKLAPAAEQPVRRFMTADLVSAGEDTPLARIVQQMIDAHVHRVVVLEGKKLRGIVSTIDVLAALLRAGG
jgi:CBS domain-containing protein